jgi:hypothetical protein
MTLRTTGTRPCYDKPIPQTVFLGSSVTGFNISLGWGAQASSLTVNLVDDVASNCSNTGGNLLSGFSGISGDEEDDAYYNSSGDQLSNTRDATSGQLVLPGKLYFHWNGTKFVSRYWKNPDPGFFGLATRWQSGGGFNPKVELNRDNNGFDIIGNPVFFKMEDFEFSGVIKNWEKSLSSGGGVTSVTIESPASLLNNSWIIIGNYAGSIFGKLQGIGGPKNYTGSALTYQGKIAEGALANVFNVYGFLESFGFGASYQTEEGIPVLQVLDALSILTSENTKSNTLRQYSPFGRIIGRTAHESVSFNACGIGFYSFGLYPPTADVTGMFRHQYTLDLSELRTGVTNFGRNFRLQSPVMSIEDFITQVTEALAMDFYLDLMPSVVNGVLTPTIKVRTISRSVQPPQNQIKNTLSEIEQIYNITQSSYGQELNASVNRAMLIGGAQQRLFQAKNHRLAYSQTNYIVNCAVNSSSPAMAQLVKYNSSSYRVPSPFSTRNPTNTNLINSANAWMFADEDNIHNAADGVNFAGSTSFSDSARGGPGGAANPVAGNYKSDTQSTYNVFAGGGITAGPCANMMPDGSNKSLCRWTPIYKDIISPFFGFEYDEALAESSDLPEESFKRPRRVYMDNFTGQLAIICKIADLPQLKYGVQTLYGNDEFVVNETEIRAAMAGFDNLVLYYAAKTYKPDLLIMLQAAYAAVGRSIIETNDPPMGLGPWGMIEDINAAGDEGPDAPISDQDEDVNVSSLLLSKSFTEDLMLIHGFINELGQKYYGKSYAIKLPKVHGYRDWTSGGSQQIGSDAMGRPVYLWAGSPKAYYSYEIAEDGAWEEPGNYIDDGIIVGSSDWLKLIDEVGKIQPILGYNASVNFDYMAYNLCNSSFLTSSSYKKYRHPPAFGVELYSLQTSQFGDGCDNAKFYYPSLDLSNVTEEYTLKDGSGPILNSYGDNSIPTNFVKKLYVKGQVRKSLYFADNNNLTDPQAIIDGPGLFLNCSSLEYTQDPNRTVIANVALEDLLLYMHNTPPSMRSNAILYAFGSRLGHMFNNKLLRTKGKKSESNQMIDLYPKAAHPFFAAVPTRSNMAVYGPWINYPHINQSTIFPNISNTAEALETLVNGVKVEVDPEMVPWNYGNAALLDKAAILRISDGSVNYQNILETGSIEILGLPIFGLGAKFLPPSASCGGIKYSRQCFTKTNETYTYTHNSFSDGTGTATFNTTKLEYEHLTSTNPVISSLQLNVGESKVSTIYSFKIYSKPLSRFNKDASDRLKKVALNSIKVGQRGASNINKIIAKQLKQFQDSVNKRASGMQGTSLSDGSKKLLGWSPVGVMVGHGSYYMPAPSKSYSRNLRKGVKKNTNVGTTGTSQTQPDGQSGNRAFVGDRGDWNINDCFNGSAVNVSYEDAKGPVIAMIKDQRHSAFTHIYQDKEKAQSELKDYGTKSFMSLDGLFSPVSFYPTPQNSCYSMAKWPTSKCPICCGTKNNSEIPIATYNASGGWTEKTITKICKYCYDDTNTKPSTTIKKVNNDLLHLPPFISVNNIDDNYILSIGADQYSQKSSDAQVNMLTLQPILQSNGDFVNTNAQAQDKKRHSIGIVGRGGRHPDSKSDMVIKNNYENDEYGVNPDFHGIEDIRLKQYLERVSSRTATSSMGNCSFTSYPLNNRFMGLRGPLILHAWGYDLNGFPVPNAADEPKFIDADGKMKRHISKKSKNADGTDRLDENGNFVYEDDYAQEGSYTPALGSIGSVISKSQERITINGVTTWTKPKKLDKFYLNWGERPDLWPVGPIDLRWDSERKVWTAPQPKVYKNVYITMEEDLVTTQNPEDTIKPCRGFITDLEYDTTSEKERKLVFVVDQSGYTAPRGAKLLCSFNAESGFYEVLSKPTFTCFGTIQGNGSEASLELTFMQARNRSQTVNTISVNFNNPFSFSVTAGQKGLFMYIDGAWNLTNTR